jgi:hypothetical protein
MPKILSDAFEVQVREAVRYVMRQTRSIENPQTTRPNTQRSVHYAITNESLSNASNALTSPGTAEGEVLSLNSSGNLERSGVKHTVTNRYESISLAVNTLIVIMRVNGEWILAGADCAALASPPV